LLPAVLACLVQAPASRGHDIPDARVDRAIQITLSPGRLRVDYEVSLAELTLARDLRRLTGPIPQADQRELFERYGQVTAPLNARGLLGSVDGRALELAAGPFDLSVEEHPRFVFHYEAAVPPSGRLILRDHNYVSSEGTSRLALRGSGGVEVKGYTGPARIEDVAIVPVWLLSDEEERATRGVEVDYVLPPTAAPLERETAARVTNERPPPEKSPRAPKGLSRLLGERPGPSWILLWFVALGLGAAHSIQPGHGKSLVAAFSLGSRGGWLAGGLLGVLTTLVHMSSVLALALLLWLTRSTRYTAIDESLRQIAGFLIAAVGVFRLGRHLGGHPQHAGALDRPQPGEVGWGALLGLAFAGGLVPCWDAVLLVVMAELAEQLPLGLFLLSGFSLGMAGVLVAVGLAAGRIRRGLERGRAAEQWSRWLGTSAALALVAIGMYLWMA
jgi:ABC-type nickel/cobalt efflux system permease component RcnA